MPLLRRHLLPALLLPLLGACTTLDDGVLPKLGQEGKDAVWVPTPDEVVQRMLEMAGLQPGERLVDLGSGDGKIPIAAARLGAQARGIEYNPQLVALARRKARAAGVLARFDQADVFASDFSEADVVTLYLPPQVNLRLRPTLLAMRPGTRVVSHDYGIGDWVPDRSEVVTSRDVHLWIVPARVAGTWTVRIDGQPPLQMELRPHYQEVEGHVLVDGVRIGLHSGRLTGSAIRFGLPAPGGSLLFAGSTGHDGPMAGEVLLPGGARRAFTATRRPA